jgi:hypothetical protein
MPVEEEQQQQQQEQEDFRALSLYVSLTAECTFCFCH